MRPLAIDLYCGLGGWTEGLLAVGYDVVGFDVEQHAYDGERYPAQLVLQDVLTLHGAQFRDAALIVASPPCQFFSYTAMPWTRAKALAAEVRADPALLAAKLALFNACFRIQREAIEAAGRFVPLVVENVRGAQRWVGRSRASFGSYHVWGDVPALMPEPTTRKVPTLRSIHRGDGSSLTHIQVGEGVKGAHGTDGSHWTNPAERRHVADGRKGAGAGAEWFDSNLCQLPSSSPRRKAASAKIAKIPRALSEWIGRAYLPC